MTIATISRPAMTQEVMDTTAKALANERLVMGESVFKFEEEFARYIGVDHAVSVSSGTDALILVMIALYVSNGEAITTSFSFVATASSIVHAGTAHRFTDVSGDYDLDPGMIRTHVNIAAVLSVHLRGNPTRIDEIAEAAGRNVIPRYYV